jgi:hypothetical protein
MKWITKEKKNIVTWSTNKSDKKIIGNVKRSIYRVMRFSSNKLFTTASRTALGPTLPPIQWVPGALSPGVKRSGHEAEHSPPASVEVKDEWSYTSTPQCAFMAWCSIKKKAAQGQLCFYLYLITVKKMQLQVL